MRTDSLPDMSEQNVADTEQHDIPEVAVFHTRAYQQEMLEESLHKNLVIALDTGSGKTHIAVLRMKLEAEREANKVSWFLAPTVALVEQQCSVIKDAIPVSVSSISGASEPNQWKDVALWKGVLNTHRIIVSTPQILLDALRHGYINLGRDIGLLVFDEAHHAVSKHPYNMIMQEFYFQLPPRSGGNTAQVVRPMILGLTASPIYGGNVDLSFYQLEHNLDSTIRSSRVNREELSQYVHKPAFKHVLYASSDTEDAVTSINYLALKAVVDSLNIENDPFVRSLRAQLARARPGDERKRIDQKLSKTIQKEDTFCHKGLRDFARAAQEIGIDLGPWAADWYVVKVIEQARHAANPFNNIMASWQDSEKRYLLECLSKVYPIPVSNDVDDIRAGISDKARTLVDCLVTEEAEFRSVDETYSGIVFVTRRDTVLALAEVLQRLPEISPHFRIGCLIGSSSTFQRHSFLDITRNMAKDSQQETLSEFRSGEKNLIISTAVAEEGIDIQACGCVIRFDPPPNVVAWAQSRGRARKEKSSFILMFENGGAHLKLIKQWEQAEARMMDLYNDTSRTKVEFEDDDDDDESPQQYIVASTGAVLTLHSATSHLNHFCAVLPNSAYGGQLALYDLDPPDFPDDWHSQQHHLRNLPAYKGPWGATVTLPRALPRHLRTFSTPRKHDTKRSAQRHAAFAAYVELHKAGLLNDHLLPLTSAIEPDQGEEVKNLLEEIEKRAGTERVSVQMDPWATKSDQVGWWHTELDIQGLPIMHMLTRNPLPTLIGEDSLTLYIPGRGAVRVCLRPSSKHYGDGEFVERARTYTHRIFATSYHAYMKPGNSDFSYLFLPVLVGKDEPEWEDRRKWQRTRMAGALTALLETTERANADAFGKQFAYPPELSLVRPNDKFGKALRFMKWQHKRLTSEEEEQIIEDYECFPGAHISYPLLQVKPFAQRANFLVPLSYDDQGLNHDDPIFLLPQYATVELVSTDDVEFSTLLPSVLRSLANTMTVMSLREELLAGSNVSQVPLSLLSTAITAPVAQELINYQRLETLGDTVLKYIVSIQLFADHPLWHEGYLARRKDHAVSNVQLAKAAISKSLYQWIIRDRFVPRKWRPHYMNDSDASPIQSNTSTELDEKDANKKRTQELSTKVLADVVESLIGAAYEHGGFDLATDCISVFGLGLTWKKIPQHITAILANLEDVEDPPSQLSLVETMLGYQFSHKVLLVQALTHASYNGDMATMSYERLEFLGDCTLDMIVTDYLYHAPGKNFKPGHMHIHKEALVNSHFLAYICLKTHTVIDASMPIWTATDGTTIIAERQRIHLWQCLLHSSHRVLEDQNVTSARFAKCGGTIEEALRAGTMYPWAVLTSLQAPKFISDMIESLLGAVYIDSLGDLNAVRTVLRNLGIMDIMERIVEQGVDVQHPISRLTIWADKQDPKQKVKLEVKKEGGNVSCAVMIDDKHVVEVTEPYRSRASQEEVRFAAAEQAIQLLHVVEKDDEWGDAPDYDW